MTLAWGTQTLCGEGKIYILAGMKDWINTIEL
jgi:hypothetical protein